MDVSTPEKAAKVGDHLIGLACGHFWPGNAESDERASEILALFMATGDSTLCPYCHTQQRITGPLAKVLDADGGSNGTS